MIQIKNTKFKLSVGDTVCFNDPSTRKRPRISPDNGGVMNEIARLYYENNIAIIVTNVRGDGAFVINTGTLKQKITTHLSSKSLQAMDWYSVWSEEWFVLSDSAEEYL